MTNKPTFRDWTLACIALAFTVIGIVILPSNRDVGITTTAFFGACLAVFVIQLRRKLRYGRMKIVSVDVAEGFRLQRKKGRVALLGAALAALGVVLHVFSHDVPMLVRVCYWVIAGTGVLVLATVVSGRLPTQALEFQCRGLAFINGKWSVLLPWTQIRMASAGEISGNPALLMAFEFPEVPPVSPPEMQAKFEKYVAQCRKWGGVDFYMLTTHYDVDLPVLVAAINDFRTRPSSEINPAINVNVAAGNA